MSVPSAPAHSDAATAAAEPPDEPPGTCASDQGFRTGLTRAVLVRRAHRELVHVQLAQRSRRPRPRGAPSPSTRRAGRSPRRIFDAQVVSTPRVQKMSLSPIGTPASGARIASRLAGGVDRVGAAAGAVGVDQQVSSRARRRGARCDRGTARRRRARSHLPARTPSAIATAVAPRASIGALTIRHLPSRRRTRGRFAEPGRSCRRGAGRSPAPRRATATASPRLSRVGQSNGTACVIGSIDAVSSARRASTYSRIAPRLSVIAVTSCSDRRKRASNASSRTSSPVIRDMIESRFIPRLTAPTPRGSGCGFDRNSQRNTQRGIVLGRI